MKQKILLAMSGGVDSSVAALLLKKQGYEVIGAFMRNWSNTKNSFGECAWRDERRMAQKIAAILDIPLITLNFEKEYKKLVVNEMFKLYKKGITPNPDVDCNNKIKFPLLIKAAKKLKCEFVATGHYARIKQVSINKKFSLIKTKSIASVSEPILGRAGGNNLKTRSEAIFELHRAKDESKDQSYFLYRLNQNHLKKTIFPIGNLTKIQVREIAKKNNFPNFDKKSTVGICFIGKVNLKKFLQKKIKPKKGRILDPDGNVIGEHDGIFYYTIGQRIGPRFGIEVKKNETRQKKYYVAKKNLKTNTIVAAPENHSLNFRKEIFIKNPYWITKTIATKLQNKYLYARIRQVGELLQCKLNIDKKNKKLKLILKKAITGISQGQAVVLYEKTKCLGGGVIEFY